MGAYPLRAETSELASYPNMSSGSSGSSSPGTSRSKSMHRRAAWSNATSIGVWLNRASANCNRASQRQRQ